MFKKHATSPRNHVLELKNSDQARPDYYRYTACVLATSVYSNNKPYLLDFAFKRSRGKWRAIVQTGVYPYVICYRQLRVKCFRQVSPDVTWYRQECLSQRDMHRRGISLWLCKYASFTSSACQYALLLLWMCSSVYLWMSSSLAVYMRVFMRL